MPERITQEDVNKAYDDAKTAQAACDENTNVYTFTDAALAWEMFEHLQDAANEEREHFDIRSEVEYDPSEWNGPPSLLG